MRNHRFDADPTLQGNHWAWLLVPIPMALALFGAIWLLPSPPEAAATFAVNTLSIPAEPPAAGSAPELRPTEPEPDPVDLPPTF